MVEHIFKIPSEVPETFNTNWYYDSEEALPPDGAIGFVYCITNKTNGKRYFGKKLCRFKKTKQKTVTLKNGTKKKKKIATYVDSDWREYYGSNDYLKKDVVDLGAENFYREVLEWCFGPGEMTYIETWYHFAYGVLLNPEKAYNAWIMARCSTTHIKRLITEEKNGRSRIPNGRVAEGLED